MRTDQGPVIGIDLGTTNSAVFFTDRLGAIHPVKVATGNQAPTTTSSRRLPSIRSGRMR